MARMTPDELYALMGDVVAFPMISDNLDPDRQVTPHDVRESRMELPASHPDPFGQESMKEFDRVTSTVPTVKDPTLKELIANKDMSPSRRRQLFGTYHVTDMKHVGRNHAYWIDEKAVPDHLHLHWISPNTTAWVGDRPYFRVPNRPDTRLWVPHAKQMGSSAFIRHGVYWLGWRLKEDWLRERMEAHQQGNEQLEERDDRFRSILEKVAPLIPGVNKDKLKMMDALGLGRYSYRSAEPGGPDLDYKDVEGGEQATG